MPNVTTCTSCGALYEAGSEEAAIERGRLCRRCSGRLTIKAINWAAERQRLLALVRGYDAETQADAIRIVDVMQEIYEDRARLATVVDALKGERDRLWSDYHTMSASKADLLRRELARRESLERELTATRDEAADLRAALAQVCGMLTALQVGEENLREWRRLAYAPSGREEEEGRDGEV